MHSLRYASNTGFLFQPLPETSTTTTRSATRRLLQRHPIDVGHVGVGQDPADGTGVGLHLRRRGRSGDHRRHLGQTRQPRHRQLEQRVPTLGGERLTRPGLAAFGGRIGYLLQRTELFRDSIAENLLMGRPGASDDELENAMAAVGLDRVVANLPNGLRHRLGDGGSGLSGGERRRLGVARLLVASPDVYVFDEATEGLDAATAALVIENIRSKTRGRAVLLATHHRDEAKNADRLLWIERGKVIQIANKGEAAFDAILGQLNPRGARRLDGVRGGMELLIA